MAAEHKKNVETKVDENWIRCKGNCFRTVEGESRRCESYGRHGWCCNYMVNQNLPVPEFFEACDQRRGQGVEILSVTDASFREYGQIVDGYDKEELLALLRSEIEIPQNMAYVPKDERLMRLPIAKEISERFYGGMPAALGWVSGHNTKLNCLEYHRDSELNLGTEDFILLLGRRTQMETDHTFDTSKVKAFLIPAGVMVEIYATTLHYAPCQADARGFRVFAVLPDGSNTKKPEIRPMNEEDRLLFAKNKGLLAHPDSQEAAAGAFVGLKGTNIDISKSL